MKVVGIDPSYSRTGICIIDSENKTVHFEKVGDTIGDKTIVNLYHAAVSRVEAVFNIVKKSSPIETILVETPPPSGSFGAGLFGLDFLLYYKLSDLGTVYGVAPTYVSHIHKTRKYTKSDSVKLANALLEIYQRHEYKVSFTGRLSHDECESLLFATRALVSYNIEIAKDILSQYPQFADNKEFKL